jgi:hypothetical protein
MLISSMLLDKCFNALAPFFRIITGDDLRAAQLNDQADSDHSTLPRTESSQLITLR